MIWNTGALLIQQVGVFQHLGSKPPPDTNDEDTLPLEAGKGAKIELFLLGQSSGTLEGKQTGIGLRECIFNNTFNTI